MADTPQVIDAVAIAAVSNYLIPPRTPVYAIQFASVVGGAMQFRYVDGSPWVPVVAGDFYDYGCHPITDGILFDLAGSVTSAIVQYSTVPNGLRVD